MTHDDLQSLLGAYALDALDPDEVAEVEEHLAECPRCRAEVAAHRQTASLLATPGGVAPPAIWDRIAAELSLGDVGADDDLPEPPRSLPPLNLRSPGLRAPDLPPQNGAPRPDGPPPDHQQSNVIPLRRRPRRVALPAVAALATAAAVAAVVLGVSASNLNHRVNDLSSALHQSGLQQAAASAVLSSEHQNVQLTSATSSQAAEVVILPNGNAYLVRSDLPALDAARTYQLWGLVNGKAVSLGLLGADPTVVAFRVERDVSRLMVTAEPSGGVPQPTTPVLVQGNIV
ncbi:MAG: anti-sigma factor [Acidimicrobiaceae bacterium]|nr:anti-sigma factor [Acidimicrobiaceae bacterium]